MPASPFTLIGSLNSAQTSWEAACALLRHWRASGPPEVPWHSDVGSVYDAWSDIADRTRAHFEGARAADDFDEADRELLVRITGRGTSADAVHAAAWGLSMATAHTFAPAWRDALATDRYTLRTGDYYPVADAPWDLAPLIPRPASSASPAAGELPFIRVHDASAFDVTVDFTLARPLEAIARSLDGFVALHPNERQDELALPLAEHQVFPVAPKDATAQRAMLVALVESALASGAPISILPELSLTAQDVDALHALVADWDDPHLLVAGSHHTTIDGHPENVAEGLVSGQERRMRHLKAMPFSNELRLRPPEKEGIRQRARPHVIVHQADCFRVAIAICKELLDPATTDPLDRMGVNLLLVPAFSEKTQAFREACGARALRAQATTIVVNGPLRDAHGALVSPAIVVGQPVDGATTAGFTVRGPTPMMTPIGFPAEPLGNSMTSV